MVSDHGIGVVYNPDTCQCDRCVHARKLRAGRHREQELEDALRSIVNDLRGPAWCWECGYRIGHNDGCRIKAALMLIMDPSLSYESER